jgi:RNA-directed DNA polymerase
VVEQFLAERGLELSPDKTVITHIEDGFDFFLGAKYPQVQR